MYSEFKKLLGDRAEFIYLDEVDSTSSYIRRNPFSRNSVVVAGTQSSGRGRNGKSFYSPSSTGLYMSVQLNVNCSLTDAVGVTTAVAVAVANAIEKVTKCSLGIKWVNDLYLNGKKVCGILCEAINDYKQGLTKMLIIGIGVNLSTADFPQELSQIAGSLGVSEKLKPVLAAEIADAILKFEPGALTDELLNEYRRRSIVIGKCVSYSVNGQYSSGLAVEIDEKGGLIIERPSGERTVLNSGEISLRLV